MKRATILTATLALCLAGFASEALAGDPPCPPGSGLNLFVQKKNYRFGETVKFMLYKNPSTMDDMPANLEGSYYIISYRQGNRGKEFYTSRREPFGTSLDLGKKLVFTWDQWDNERLHRAQPGQWRIRFVAPKGNISKPLEVRFTIR